MGDLVPMVTMGLVIGYMLLGRLNRLIGRQRITTGFMVSTVVTGGIGLLTAIFLVSLGAFPAMIGLVGGLGAGLVAAGIGLALTTVERRPDGVFYTPNVLVGIGVYATAIMRFVYSFAVGIRDARAPQTAAATADGNAFARYAHHPWTAAAFFLLVGYTVCYNLGVLWQLTQEEAEVPAIREV